jgi:hypothetical protein
MPISSLAYSLPVKMEVTYPFEMSGDSSYLLTYVRS